MSPCGSLTRWRKASARETAPLSVHIEEPLEDSMWVFDLTRAADTTPFDQWFATLDIDSDGRLTPEDFDQTGHAVLEQRGWTLAEPRGAAVHAAWVAFGDALLASMDEMGEGSVGLEAFVGYCLTVSNRVQRDGALPDWAAEQVGLLFEALDLDGDGCISTGDFEVYRDILPDRECDLLEAIAPRSYGTTEADLKARFAHWWTFQGPAIRSGSLVAAF